VALARESYDPRLTRVYDDLRARLGVRAIYRGQPGAAVRIVRTLRRGSVLGIPMDLRTRAPSTDAPFLGVAAPTVIGPARLALRTGAAVVVGSIERRGQHLAVTATRLHTADARRARNPVQALTERLNEEISRRILTLPEEWPWMHSRWDLEDFQRP
jgi:lauroyl/myristoyl acyltransferase